MNNTRKLSLFIIAATLVSCVIACYTPEVSEVKDSRSQSAPPPFRWLEVSERYKNIKDYTAVYEKEERAISTGEKQTMHLSFRKPLDIRLEWLNEKGQVDQTAVYREGLNDGAILMRKSGLLGSMVGTVRIKTDSAIAREDSKHPITTVGLGNLIERITAEADKPQTETTFLGEEISVDGRVAYKIEMSNAGGLQLTGGVEQRKATIFIDKQLLLPIKVEVYDAEGVLDERHIFKDLKLNVQLTDKTFEMR
jgi:outer membrane lipoprotein-sorting protein